MRFKFQFERVVRRPFARRVDGGDRLEVFLVTSVTSILAIRTFLGLTGYPQLSGGGLHIAHVLLGGFFMLVSIVLLLAFLDRHSADLAAVLGGFGFGAFIDELGKFITADNNYFFQPTVALIYVTFVLLYVSFRAIGGRQTLNREERMMNALETAKDAVLDGLDDQERKRALEILDGGDVKDPIAVALRRMILAMDSVPASEAGLYYRAKELAKDVYLGLIKKSWFNYAVVALFVIQSLISLLETSVLVLIKALEASLKLELVTLTPSDWVGIAAPALASIFVLAGILQMKRNRLKAYYRFKSAVLIQIFFVQVIAFYQDQLAAITGLGANILILAVLRYVIAQEEAMKGDVDGRGDVGRA